MLSKGMIIIMLKLAVVLGIDSVLNMNSYKARKKLYLYLFKYQEEVEEKVRVKL